MMDSSPHPFRISPAILEEVYREARKSFPAECCGWLAGPRDGPEVTAIRRCVNAQNSGTHPTAPERGAETAYVFTAEDLIDLNRSLDTDQPALVIYHSHPNGQAYLSETDRTVATSPWGDGPAYPVQQLVVGIDSQRVVEAALFAWSDAEGGFAEIARFPGADI
jgi:[CysO sulfur-carrier protein]-S-L-cysteine hydrolase